MAYLFSQIGTLCDGKKGNRQPEFLLERSLLQQDVIIEVTAVSDRGAQEANPAGAFLLELGRRLLKRKVMTTGGIRFELGERRVGGKVILAVPEKTEFQPFFGGDDFKGFLSSIKNNPSAAHILRMDWRGASSEFTYVPGLVGQFVGVHSEYSRINDIDKNFVRSALQSKHTQIKESLHAVPAIVVLCCNCTTPWNFDRTKPNDISIVDVVNRFFADTQTISAVLVVDIAYCPEKDARVAQGRLLRNPRARYPLPAAADDAITHMFRASPKLHKRPDIRKKPQFWGGVTIKTVSDNKSSLEISLESVLSVLTGRMSVADFQQAHPDATRWLLNCEPGKFDVSNVTLTSMPDDDDDFLVFEKTECASFEKDDG